MNGWPRGGERPQCLQRPLGTCRDAVGPLAAGKLFPRSYLAGNGGTKQRPGSVPAKKSSPALAPLTILVPSARDIRKTRQSDSSASLRTVLRKSNPVEHSETSKHFWIGSNHTRRSEPGRSRHVPTARSSQPCVCALERSFSRGRARSNRVLCASDARVHPTTDAAHASSVPAHCAVRDVRD
jgi:hypothetical protein